MMLDDFPRLQLLQPQRSWGIENVVGKNITGQIGKEGVS